MKKNNLIVGLILIAAIILILNQYPLTAFTSTTKTLSPSSAEISKAGTRITFTFDNNMVSGASQLKFKSNYDLYGKGSQFKVYVNGWDIGDIAVGRETLKDTQGNILGYLNTIPLDRPKAWTDGLFPWLQAGPEVGACCGQNKIYVDFLGPDLVEPLSISEAVLAETYSSSELVRTCSNAAPIICKDCNKKELNLGQTQCGQWVNGYFQSRFCDNIVSSFDTCMLAVSATCDASGTSCSYQSSTWAKGDVQCNVVRGETPYTCNMMQREPPAILNACSSGLSLSASPLAGLWNYCTETDKYYHYKACSSQADCNALGISLPMICDGGFCSRWECVEDNCCDTPTANGQCTTGWRECRAAEDPAKGETLPALDCSMIKTTTISNQPTTTVLFTNTIGSNDTRNYINPASGGFLDSLFAVIHNLIEAIKNLFR